MRCPYCAFEIIPSAARPEPTAWLEGVRSDLERWRSHFPGEPTTLYFGGGTPSRLDPDVLAAVASEFGPCEITVEANPEDLTDAWLQGALAVGVNRISLGVQTLDPKAARRVGRAGPDAFGALHRLQTSGLQSWSADLMFGLPHQTLEELEADLEALLRLEPPHVSLYGLTIEPGTGYARVHQRRPLAVADEDLWREMYDHLVARLEAEGLHRYEVSNFARAGHESQHNKLYWTGRPYMGLGPSAHGLAPDGRRWQNAPMPQWPCPPEIEQPTAEEKSIDLLVSGLRASAGIAVEELPVRPGSTTLSQLVTAGLLAGDEHQLRLTDQGFPVADAVIRALVRSLGSKNG